VSGDLVGLLVAVAVALVSMVAYGAIHGRRGVASQHSAKRGTFALGGWVRDWFYWAIHPLERPIAAWRVPPEVFNALGVLLGFAALAAYASGKLALGGWMLLASGLADVLDGVAARVRGLVSRYGAFLDSTLDRFAEAAAFVGLVLFYRAPGAVVVVVVALTGSLLVSYTRARGEGLGVQCKLGVLQRAERLILLGLGSLLDPSISAALGRETGSVLLPVIALIAGGSTGTAVFRTIWISRELRRLDRKDP